MAAQVIVPGRQPPQSTSTSRIPDRGIGSGTGTSMRIVAPTAVICSVTESDSVRTSEALDRGAAQDAGSQARSEVAPIAWANSERRRCRTRGSGAARDLDRLPNGPDRMRHRTWTPAFDRSVRVLDPLEKDGGSQAEATPIQSGHSRSATGGPLPVVAPRGAGCCPARSPLM